MKQGNSSWWFWLLLIILLFGTGSIIPLFLIVAVVLAITFSSINAYKKTSGNEAPRGYRRKGNYRRSTNDSSKIATINVYLRKYFRTRKSILVEDVELRVRGDRFTSLGVLDVYQNNGYLCNMNEYQRRFPDSYNNIINELSNLAVNHPIEDEVIDAEVVENPEPKQETAQNTQSKKEKNAQYYIDEINDLNDDIPDEKISNGLYETCSLLKQIQTLEVKFPKSRDKLKKLYEYYLPILTKILKQYASLQYAKTDPSYEETKNKLTRTIDLINDAMEKIISSMTDQDFINLSADISTLEAVLQKDGLTEEGTMRSSEGE